MADDWPFEDAPAYLWTPDKPSDERWSLSTWWLQTPAGWSFIYGWTLPRPGDATSRVVTADVGRVQRNSRLVRVVADGSATAVFSLTNSLLGGRNLGEACGSAGLAAEGGLLDELRFGVDQSAIERDWVRFPWMVFESSGITPYRTDGVRAPHSLAGDALCVARAVVRRDLRAIFGGEELPDDAQVEKLAQLVGADTGLSFRAEGFQRFGALEAMWFPSLSRDETSLVSVDVAGDGIRVRIKPTQDICGLVVRHRQEARGSVLSDETRVLDAQDREEFTCVFGAPSGGPFSTFVSIWVKRNGEESYTLWYEDLLHFIRQIRTRFSLQGRQLHVDSDWLTAFANARRTSARAARMRKVVQSTMDTESTIGEPYPDFEELIANRRRVSAAVAQTRSGDRFFLQGDGIDGGRLDFAEWLRESLDAADVSRAVLIDPYFDTWGLEILLRTQRSNKELIVVTSGQHRSDEGQGLRQRFARAANGIRLLGDGRISVYDVRTSTDVRSSPFHDRYLLLFGESSEPARGFHLSNSLQLATLNYPLLVTRISPDVLVEVFDYVAGFLGANEQGGRAVQRIYPVDEAPDRSSSPTSTVGLLSLEECVAALRASSDQDFAAAWERISDRFANVRGIEQEIDSVVGELGESLLDRIEQLLTGVAPFREQLGIGEQVQFESIAISQLLNRDFLDALESVTTALGHHRRSHMHPWSLYYAAYLLSRRPARLIRVLEQLVPIAGATDRSPDAAVALAAGHCADALLDAGQTGNLSLARELMQSAAAGLRALGVAVAERSSDVARIDAVTDSLQSDLEKVMGLAAWVSRMRISANRGRTGAGTRVDSGDSRESRLRVFSAMMGEWPRGTTPETLRRVAVLAGGPGDGSWSKSTHEEFFVPLAEQGGVTEDAVVEMWSDILNARMQREFDKGHGFHGATDNELTELVALLWTTRSERSSQLRQTFAELELTGRRARRVLGRPFVRATDYEAWSRASRFLLWMGVLFGITSLVDDVPEWIGPSTDVWLNASASARSQMDSRDPSGLVSLFDAIESEREQCGA